MQALTTPMTRLLVGSRQTTAWREIVAWACLGLVGSAAIVLTAGQLTGGSVRWWLDPHLVSGSGNEAILYAGMVLLTVAWLGLGRHARRAVMPPGALWIVAGVWTIPLLLSAPVFSRDVYSYLAQGTILHHGLNPYHDLPTALGGIGQHRVLNAVDPFWRHTTAPYGPLFLETVSGIAGVSGSHVVLGAQLVKLLGLAGLVLLAVFVPGLARTQGYDPARATWLAVLNPLVLFALVVPGHNDLLMVGLMVAGVAVGVERWPLVGIAICALAATIKLPALLAAGFIAVVWARGGLSGSDRARRLGASALVTLAVLGVVTLIAGVGVSWVTSTLFSAPARVKLAITPSSGLACTAAWLTSSCTRHNVASFLPAFRALAGVVTLLLLLEFLRRARASNVARYAGLALVALAWGGPAAWPWYFVWGLALLAASAGALTVAWSVVLMVAGAFVVKPDGILAIPLESAPYVMGCYLVAAAVGWYAWRRWRGPRASALAGPEAALAATPGPDPAPTGSALVKP